jgi:decaprenylphospho-beta-D-ribofuranose 2-oxidase
MSPPETLDARRLVRGWGRATGSHSTVTRPYGDQGWLDQLAAAGSRGLIARGAGCGYGDAAQNAGGTVGLTEVGIDRLTIVDGSAEVDAGVSLGELVRALAPAGWTLPVVPGAGRVTVGGAIAADVHGKNHRARGTFGACVREMSVLTPGRGLLTMGPGVEADAFWATLGGLGLTGVIRRARLDLVPLDSWWMRTADGFAADLTALLAALDDAATRSAYAVAWIDARRRGRSVGGGIVSAAQPAITSRGDRPYPGPARLAGMPALPGAGLAWPPLAATANRARLLGARLRPRRLRPLPDVLYPLDAVPYWPALHGRRGLVQYQFVVPKGAENVLAAALIEAQRAGCPATLAVLKVFGAGNPGALSFPQPGWSLALDFPADPALARVLDGHDARVADAGGRVYLVKDSRLRPDLLEAMYPRLPEWRAERVKLDPDQVMASDLSRRLGLTGGRHA